MAGVFVCLAQLAYFTAVFDWSSVAHVTRSSKEYSRLIRVGELVSAVLVSFPNQVTSIGIILALFLYSMRRRFRTYYGIIEILSGLVALYVFPMAHADPSQEPANWTGWLVGFFAPIYIIIRGLDNAEVGWPKFSFRPGRWLMTVRRSELFQGLAVLALIFAIFGFSMWLAGG